MVKFNTKKQFFASANGYGGFVSYFNAIFDLKKLNRLYILKGGPGTGKSTFMKKAVALAEECGADVEIFRCSSDINSLDGVLIKNKSGRLMGILDGTAPHTKDSELPGACDRLVDLGAAWNEDKLTSAKKEIEHLSEAKKNCYSAAYRYLGISSVFEDYIKAEIKKSFIAVEATKLCKRIIDLINPKETGEYTLRLVSSFSDIGYTTLPTIDIISKKKYSVSGIHGSDRMLIGILVKHLLNNGYAFTAFPSAYDKNSYEAIYFQDTGIALVSDGCGENIADTAGILNLSDLFDRGSSEDLIYNNRAVFLDLAAKKISEAKKYHFELENIYTAAMNFSLLTEITDEILEKIKAFLFG